MVSEILFFGLLACVAAQRLWECRRSLHNERRLRAWGAVEHAHAQVPVMVALHVAWFVAMPLEIFLLGREPRAVLAIAAFLIFVQGQLLRVSAIRALGTRWTIKVLTLPGARTVSDGPFRRIRHPNYLGVWLETVALPLVHGAFITALVFGIAQALFLALRIRAEEAALSATTDYQAELAVRPRFVPRGL
jgi:methyltransferase